MGAVESIKGTVKEKVGALTDNDELEAEGKAQRTKGEEEARETAHRAEAKAHEAKAESLDKRQDQLES